MAVQIIVRMIDDLDGTSGEDVSRVHFGLDGVFYEIDLNPANEDRLRGVLDRFVQCARRRDESSASAQAARWELTSKIRLWAQENGFNLCVRGRIPTAAILAYGAAHPLEGSLEEITRTYGGLDGHSWAE